MDEEKFGKDCDESGDQWKNKIVGSKKVMADEKNYQRSGECVVDNFWFFGDFFEKKK